MPSLEVFGVVLEDRVRAQNRLEWLIRCTLGRREHSLIICLFILLFVDVGISARGRRVEYMILLVGYFVTASVIKVVRSEMNSFTGVLIERTLVPVWIRSS